MGKPALAAVAPPARRAATWRTLAWVLDRYLRVLHPLMPHVTEEIWSRSPHAVGDPDLLIVAPWPTAEVPALATVTNSQRASGVAGLIELISAVRAARAEAGIQPAEIIDATLWLPDGPARAAFDDLKGVVERLARIRATTIVDRAALDAGTASLAVVTPYGEARLVRSDADQARETARLEKELRGAQAALAAADGRLADPNFTGRAPATVVEQAQRRAAELREQVGALRSRLGQNS
jgi:valyl-tRNA synthetase